MRVLLLHLHSGPVLSPVLHPHPLGHGAGDGSRPPLVLRVHLSHPGGATVGPCEQVIFVSSSAFFKLGFSYQDQNQDQVMCQLSGVQIFVPFFNGML